MSENVDKLSEYVCDEELTVDSFFKRPFSTRPHLEKLAIVRGERPQPALSTLLSTHQEKYRNIYQSTTRERSSEYVLQFQAAHYDRVPWLAGSEKRNKLYCWPCLLFSVEKSVWNCEGYDHLKSLVNAVQKHDRSQTHVSSVVAYKTFGSVDSAKPSQLLAEEYKRMDQHNAKVRKNQEILRCMIDVLYFISKQEYPLHGHFDGQCSLDKSNFMETLKLISAYIPSLKEYLESSTNSPESIVQIGEDLVEALVNVMNRSEVNNVRYVSLVLDETSDKTGKSQLATALRYVTVRGETCERLVHFDDVTEDESPTASFEHVYKTVGELNVKDKLTAHSYAAMTKDIEGLCTKVQESFPKASFVHYHGHKLNVTLQQSLYHMKKCRDFFQTVNALGAFFVNSPKRVDRLCKFTWKRFDTVIRPSLWRCTSQLANTVSRYRYELVEFFKELLEDRDVVDDVIMIARGFLASFNAFDFRFLLNVFSTLFDHTDALCKVLRTKSFDVECCIAKMVVTLAAVRADRARYEVVWTQVVRDTLEIEPPRGKVQRNIEQRKETYRGFHRDIINTITKQIECRFSTLEAHVFIGLVNPDTFDVHAKRFPEDLFTNLLQTRNTLFDFSRLKTELIILHRLNQFRGKPPGDLMFFLRDKGLKESMPELYRLCNFVLAMPSTCPSAEPTFSVLKRMRRHAMVVGTSRLTNMSLLAIENGLLAKLRNRTGFYEEVIGGFTRQGQKEEFTYITQEEPVDEFVCKSYF